MSLSNDGVDPFADSARADACRACIAAAVAARYPDTEPNVPCDQKQGTIPATILADIELDRTLREERGRSKNTSTVTLEKAATPNDALVNWRLALTIFARRRGIARALPQRAPTLPQCALEQSSNSGETCMLRRAARSKISGGPITLRV